jgi:hypothetical protein
LNLFWLDYATFLIDASRKDFLTESLTEIDSEVDAFLANCIMSLPSRMETSVHKQEADKNRGMVITAGSNVVFFKKEIKQVEIQLEQDLMITHRYRE